jgi:hypothetical protein
MFDRILKYKTNCIQDFNKMQTVRLKYEKFTDVMHQRTGEEPTSFCHTDTGELLGLVKGNKLRHRFLAQERGHHVVCMPLYHLHHKLCNQYGHNI